MFGYYWKKIDVGLYWDLKGEKSQCMDVCLPGPKKVAVVKRWPLAEVRL